MMHDPDIDAMPLTDIEKNGMQVFRNYQRAFDDAAEKKFASEVDALPVDLTDLERILRLVRTEDTRAIPIIACSFADERLLAAFKTHVPPGIPGGWKAFSGSHGPISSFYGKIQIGYFTEICSREVLGDVERLRVSRNRIAHSWEHDSHQDHFERAPASEMYAVESILAELSPDMMSGLLPRDVYRIRVGWVLTRLLYETMFYARAKNARLDASRALFGSRKPKVLSKFTALAMAHTLEISGRAAL